MINLKHILKEFNSYALDYPNTEKINVKIKHMLRVMENNTMLAKSLGLSDEEIKLAGAIGILHDIGRFEQVKQYNTFVDKDSFDHAEYSAQLLEDGLIRRFIPDTTEYDQVIINSVRFHSRFKLPETLQGLERMQAQLIRDADKIDIYKQITDYNAREVFDGPSPLPSDMIDEKVLREFLAGHCIKNSDMKTKLDDYVRKCALVYDFNFPKQSCELLKKADSINSITNIFLKAFPSSNLHTNAQIQTVRTRTLAYIDRCIEDIKPQKDEK